MAIKIIYAVGKKTVKASPKTIVKGDKYACHTHYIVPSLCN